MKSLRDVLTTFNQMDFRSSFPQGKTYRSKNIVRKEEERLRLRKEKKLEEKKRANQRIKEAKKKSKQENRGRRESKKSGRLRKA